MIEGARERVRERGMTMFGAETEGGGHADRKQTCHSSWGAGVGNPDLLSGAHPGVPTASAGEHDETTPTSYRATSDP